METAATNTDAVKAAIVTDGQIKNHDQLHMLWLKIRELACHYLLLKPNKPFVIQTFSEELLWDSNFW
jgi:hypothetical protein